MEDLKARMVLPVHWSKLTLSSHGWTEPVDDLLAAKPDIPVTIPEIGELYRLGDPGKTVPWWKID